MRKVKTKSGAPAVQIVTKTGRQVIGIDHIGSAHTDTDLALLIDIAKQCIRERQRDAGQGEFEFDLAPSPASTAVLTRAYSRLLYDTLVGVYARLGFASVVDDPVFRDLVIARIIEPASKLDTIRVLSELSLAPPSNTGIHRSLTRAADEDYRDRFSKACVEFRGTEQLTLVLYDVTTLFFQVEREDDYRVPGLSKERRLEPQIVVGLLVDERGFPPAITFLRGQQGRGPHPGARAGRVQDAAPGRDGECTPPHTSPPTTLSNQRPKAKHTERGRSAIGLAPVTRSEPPKPARGAEAN